LENSSVPLSRVTILHGDEVSLVNGCYYLCEESFFNFKNFVENSKVFFLDSFFSFNISSRSIGRGLKMTRVFWSFERNMRN